MTERKRILYLAHRIPYPPNKGDKIRSYRQLEHLAGRHDVWCAFFVDDPDDWRHVATLQKMCRAVAAVPLSPRWAKMRAMVGFAAGRTLSESYFDDPRMRRVVRRWAADVGFDATLVFSSSMAGYADAVPGGRKVLDFCDWDSLKFAEYGQHGGRFTRSIWSGEAKRLGQRERGWLAAFDACVVVTDQEAAAIDAGVAANRLHVIGNGAVVGKMPRRKTREAGPVVGFVGQMDYRPNVEAVTWFVEHVWPMVRASVPDATFRIIGRSPTGEVLRLGRQDGVEVTGAVASVRDALEACAVSVAPLRIGRGIQNKVLEAMAVCRPVVLTTAAATGIGGTDGADYELADEPREFAERVIGLLLDPDERDRLGLAGRSFVQTQFDWSREMGKLESLVLHGEIEASQPESADLLAVTS